MFKAGLARIGLTDPVEVAEDYFKKSQECYDKGKFDEALEYCASVVTMATGSGSMDPYVMHTIVHKAYCRIGDIKQRMGKFDEAYDNAAQALRYRSDGRPYCMPPTQNLWAKI